MREIQPLTTAIRLATGRAKTASQFVLRTRTWVAISTARINRPRKHRITAKISAQAIATPVAIVKLHPATGVHAERPRIKDRGRSSSHAWEAKEAWPTEGSRQP